ncbi:MULTISPECIES: hypothetical protein [Halobacteriovorax]|uniref:MotA/TolQ/ExbB proton channel domain-containing protein n=1 Tax=Halobacteriovorax vibrionivorans TaxID=2152716 RepID=A0ABY0ID41_9BACT|nr:MULTISPECIES: hypothetical protein [Halobacteriovorax]AYF44800.1 hypothetical protein BALOs_1800 [Halobacteriovorax sp. BALOs_7]RZF20879.1 hypothetical protein DAY19_12915 [Halobacteriovorax vibrionivorans]TGD46230.1 hypothetical protein EP118_12925 [Halobacteriovorax sp. Y22]
MIELVLGFFGNYLIEFMMGLLCCALVFRYLAYRHSKDDDAYYSRFTRELDACIDDDKQKNIPIDDIDSYMSNLLGRVNAALPDNALRFSNNANIQNRHYDGKEAMQQREIDKEAQSSDGTSISLNQYIGSKHGLIASIHGESSVFKSTVPPNYTELTDRIMSDDRNWTKLYGHIPIDGASRMIDILPNLFIVFGVFGTFIGIAMALPEIAAIDFNNIEKSSDNLTNFVINVAFSMKTSIAGIFFSLILTFLNTLFPLPEKRFKIFKKVETSMQNLWYHLQRGNAKEQIAMEGVLKVLQSIERYLKEDAPLKEQQHAKRDDKKDAA